jgi:hypothetical protein
VVEGRGHNGTVLIAEHANAPYALWLLRKRRKRPAGGHTTKKRDELAPPHCLPQANDRALFQFSLAQAEVQGTGA